MSGMGRSARILVVEDDAFLALDLAEHLGGAGFTVIGPATSAAEAMRLLGEPPSDAAVLDVHLGPRETSEPVAVELKARGIPFVTVTGYSHEQRPPAFDGAPVLSKPVRAVDLIAALSRCLSGG
jgi:CheY-like chemotaxis protein